MVNSGATKYVDSIILMLIQCFELFCGVWYICKAKVIIMKVLFIMKVNFLNMFGY